MAPRNKRIFAANRKRKMKTTITFEACSSVRSTIASKARMLEAAITVATANQYIALSSPAAGIRPLKTLNNVAAQEVASADQPKLTNVRIHYRMVPKKQDPGGVA